MKIKKGKRAFQPIKLIIESRAELEQLVVDLAYGCNDTWEQITSSDPIFKTRYKEDVGYTMYSQLYDVLEEVDENEKK